MKNMVRKKKSTTSNQNIFSRFYNYLEDKYTSMSNWLTEKGIPINTWNNYLEQKGLPAFAIMASILLLLIFIIIFLIFFSFSSQSTLTFNVSDYQGTSVSDIYLTISDDAIKEVFTGAIDDGVSQKIKLKIGNTYTLKATKPGYPDYQKQLTINNKEEQVSVVFSEKVEYGILKIQLKDRDNQRKISSGMVTANFTINNKTESVEGIVDIFNNHYIIIEVPISKDIELIAKADNYEDFKESNYRINSLEQEKVIEMNIASLSFEGKSKVTFVVLDASENFVNDAEVSVFNLSNDEIGSQTTIDGKALVYVNSGETITYKVKKESYKTYISDDNVSYRIINPDMTYNVVLELGGNFIDVTARAKSNFLVLDDVLVTAYNLNNIVIDSGKTDALGFINFKGINVDSNILITACKLDYFCEHNSFNLNIDTKADFSLDKIDVTNSAILNVFVVDEKNMPVPKAYIKIHEKLVSLEDSSEIPYNTSLETDLSGALSIPLRINTIYNIYAQVGDTQVSEEITIDSLKENKIIFVVDNASKMIKLDLFDENGFKLTKGSLIIKAKDGTVLFDQNLSLGEEVIFNSQGYKDLLAEYTDENFNISSVNFTTDEADSSGYIRVDFSKEVNNTDYPIIDFVGVVDAKGITTNYISLNKEYYLVFDVLFPENVYKGEVHIRAGDDTQTDSEEMSYGINGFMAMDITNFKYSTSYNPAPEPGMQSTDFLNEGSSDVLNKWLELKWVSTIPLSNKQIKIKVSAVDLSVTKLKFKYRVLYEENKLYFRDPIDTFLNQSYSTNKKSALYANTKEVVVDLFDVPLDCKDNFCISNKFIDSKDNEFSVEDFYAVKGEEYILETNIYSLKNTQLNILAETSKSFPLVSLNLFSDNRSLNNASQSIDSFEVTRDGLSISGNVLKKIYLSFIAKEIGTAYIDLKSTDTILGNSVSDNRLSFNIHDKKEMKVVVNPDSFVPYGSKFTVDVLDASNLSSINNAVISFYNTETLEFILFVKAEGTNGENGKYTIDNKFNFSSITMVVDSYGYTPFEKELYIVDDSLFILTPQEILINLGTDQITSSQSFSIQNNGDYIANNIRFGDPIWIEGPSDVFVDIRGAISINKKSSQIFEAVVTIGNDLQFTTAYVKIPIFATIGSREITKIIPVRINKGLILSDCLTITPNAVNSFVGLNLEYTAPDVFNTPYTSYNYNSNNNQNPLLAQSQNYNSYDEYMSSQNNTRNYSGSSNTRTYTDPNYYTYYSSMPNTTSEYTENTTFFIIKNNCSQNVTFTPQYTSSSMSANKDIELSLGNVTVLAGEEKVYDVIIKNHSNRKQAAKYTYDILWNNNYYSVSPSLLNIDLLDLSKALWIMPSLIQVPISQLNAQQSAVNSTRFMIKNIGTVPITDIQISQYPKIVSSNIGVTEYPREINVLEPGKTIPIDLQFEVNIKKSTTDNMFILVTGKAAGINNPISATTQIVFTISSPNCLKVSNKHLDFTLKVGEKRNRNVSLTNYCAEPVSVIGIDKKLDAYTETFGLNPLKISPASGSGNIIYPNQTATYNLELSAISLGGSPKMPMIILGRLLNSGNQVSSEDFTVSINIQDASVEESRDKMVSNISSLPLCSDSQNTSTINTPVVSIGACTESSGYCDGLSSAEFLLKKVDELQSQIKQVSSQAQAKLMNTGCSVADARNGFCKISEIGDINPLEFTFYMQNDMVSVDLVKYALNKSNYSFKNYFIETNPFLINNKSALGVYVGGNKIFLSNQFKGCGKYTVEIDGFIAASPDSIYPDRAYYYLNVLKYEQTSHCKKKITNYLNFMPWDLGLSKNQREGSWVTLFTGDSNLSKDLIKAIGKFGTDPNTRYVYSYDILSSRNNTLNVSIDDITENNVALGKIVFSDLKDYNISAPEQINVILNKKYVTSNNLVPSKVSKDFVNVIRAMVVKNDTSLKVCVSEDNSYMLILDTIKAGDLMFTTKEPIIPLNEDVSCTSLKIKSSIDETLNITSEKREGLISGFKLNEGDSLNDNINLNLIQNKDSNFLFCVKPQNPNDISLFVNQKIKITANSIYSGEGVIGNRIANVDVLLTSCAITPESFLLKTYQTIVTEHNKEDNKVFPQNNYALIDWSKIYSPEEKEEFCAVIEKVINSSEYSSRNTKLFFDYENLNCTIKDSDQKYNSKLNKSLTNAGIYFGKCSAVCAGCYAVSALVMPASIFGAAIDCLAFSCGLPALDVFASTMYNGDGGIGKGIDLVLGSLFSSKNFELFGPAAESVSTWFAGTMGSLTAGIFKTGSSAAAAPLRIGETVLDLGTDPFTQVQPIIPGTGLSSQEFKLFNSQLKNFDRYFLGVDPIKFVAADPTDLAKFNQLYTKIYSHTNPIDFTKLSSTEIDDFSRIIKNGSMVGKNSHLVGKDLFANRLIQAKSNLHISGVGTTSAVNLIDNVSRNNIVNSLDDPKTGLIKNTDDSIKVLEDKIKAIEKNNARSNLNPRKVKLDPNKVQIGNKAARKASSDLTTLNSQLVAKKVDKAALVSLSNKLKGLTLDPTTGKYVVPDELLNDFKKLNGSKVAKVGKSAKWVRGVGGFARGLGCGLLGNWAGIRSLQDDGMTNLNYSIEFKKDATFTKNILYVASMEYIEPSDGDYKSRYVIDINPYNTQDPSIISSMPTTRIDSCSIKKIK